MKLNKINERIYISDFEEERDRPSLGLIIGDKLTLGIDAGHSKEHVDEFYNLLKENKLPLPDLTILTHWHWDHSFGLHAINGISIALDKTNKELIDIKNNNEYIKELLNTNPCFALEFKNQEIIIEKADIEFKDKLDIDLGNLKVNAFHITSSHSDDSVLIYIPEDKVLFLGDSISGVYPSWEKDYKKFNIFKETIKEIDFKVAIGSHWPPFSKQELLIELDNE